MKHNKSFHGILRDHLPSPYHHYLIYLSSLFPTPFSYFVLHESVFCLVTISHHLPTPYFLCTANLSFEPCMLLNGQKEVREPHNCMEFPGSHLKWERNNTYYYKIIPAPSSRTSNFNSRSRPNISEAARQNEEH